MKNSGLFGITMFFLISIVNMHATPREYYYFFSDKSTFQTTKKNSKNITISTLYQDKINFFFHPVQPDDPPVYDYKDSLLNEKPEFTGGEESLIKFLQKNLRYPPIPKDLQIEGEVLVEFIIETDGSITNIQILQSPHNDFSKEVMRVMNLMPRWKPGKFNGNTVRVKYDLTVVFSLR